MPTISDIMTADPVAVVPEMSLRDAVEVLRGNGISGVPVISGNKIVGVLSVTDLIEFSAGRTASDAPPGDAGTQSVDYWDNVEEWAPVEEEEDPSAFFRDLWPASEESVAERWENASGSGAWDQLSEHAVGEIMTRKLCSLGPGATVQEAAGYMVERGIHRVLVMEGEELLGIVSTTDIMRAVSEGKC
jgi:CBS domain-containing protein